MSYDFTLYKTNFCDALVGDIILLLAGGYLII